MMITAGFDMNSMDNGKDYRATCLLRAIEHHQYNVVRLFLSHQAKCQKCISGQQPLNYSVDIIPIDLLASQQNVPLVLFNMLATPHDLTKALYTAVREGNAETTLYLLKLGANVYKAYNYSERPIKCFLAGYSLSSPRCIEFNAELFMRLLPKRAPGLNFLKYICEILRFQCSQKHSVPSEVLHSFIQRLDFLQPMSVCFKRVYIYPYNYIQLCIMMKLLYAIQNFVVKVHL